MAINRHSIGGNGHDRWTPDDLMVQIAADVIRSATVTERVLNVMDQFSGRLERLEQQAVGNLPVPEDFGINYQNQPAIEPDEAEAVEDDEFIDDDQQQEAQPVTATREVRPGELLALLSPQDLTTSLAKLVRFIPPRFVSRQLECVLLERDGKTLRLTAGDAGHSLTVELEGLCRGDLSMLVPARQLLAACKSFSGSELTLALDGTKLTLEGGLMSCEVEAIDPDTYLQPDEIEGESVQVPSTGLLRAFKLAMHCAIKDTLPGSVHYTNGVFLRVESGQAIVCGTDGHRLVEKVFSQAGIVDKPFQLLIPARTVGELVKLLPDSQHLITIEASKTEVTFTIPHTAKGVRKVVSHPRCSVQCKLCDVTFPPAYRDILGKRLDSKALFIRKELVAVLERAAAISEKDKPRVHFLIRREQATVTASGPSGANLSSTLSIDHTGTDFGIELDPVYLLAMAKLYEGRVVALGWLGEGHPAYLLDHEEASVRYALSPIRRD